MLDLPSNITKKSRTDQIDDLRVIRDYFIGIIASVSNEIHASLETSEQRKPTIIGGISIRKGHIPNYPRYTPDIDLESNRMFYERNGLSPIRNYEILLQEIADGVREKIVSIYGTSNNFNPQISKLREPIDTDGRKFGTLKGNIVIPNFMNWKRIVVRNEVATQKNTIFLDTVDLPVYHDFIDQSELNLYPIMVPQLVNNFANKIYAVSHRLGSLDEQSRLSRLKDIFDIWFIDQLLQASDSELQKLFQERLMVETQYDKEQTLRAINSILKDPKQFFQKIFNTIGASVKSVKSASDKEKMKRMTKGITDSFKFPEVNELSESYVRVLQRLDL